MTGFARIQGGDETSTWIWEAKSVNGRGLEVRLRLPPGFDALEIPAREAAAKRLKRGNVALSLTLNRIGPPPPPRLNEALLEQLVAIAASWRERLNAPPARIEGLMALKGVLETIEDPPDEADVKRRNAALLAALDQTLDALKAMRQAEGARLAALLAGELDEVLRLAQAARATATLRPEAVRARLTTQLDELLTAQPALNPERLAQEAALIAAKGDVKEEIDRLEAHVAAAREMLAEGGAIGRRLDFLCQEFNREANTLCSKAADVDLTRLGLQLKAVIEQFREQVQNIE
ncbi:MAG: YicC family protein [Rhodospirillales bacterium]|nr:YicC family protein [Rhodospirillales bacterium]